MCARVQATAPSAHCTRLLLPACVSPPTTCCQGCGSSAIFAVDSELAALQLTVNARRLLLGAQAGFNDRTLWPFICSEHLLWTMCTMKPPPGAVAWLISRGLPITELLDVIGNEVYDDGPPRQAALDAVMADKKIKAGTGPMTNWSPSILRVLVRGVAVAGACVGNAARRCVVCALDGAVWPPHPCFAITLLVGERGAGVAAASLPTESAHV